MKPMKAVMMPLLAGCGVLALAGCGGGQEQTALRAELESVRAMAEAADEKATAALAAAQDAETEAAAAAAAAVTASEKADRIFRANLRK